MKKDQKAQAPKKSGKKERVLEKIVVTLLVVFVSLLSFSVGVMSGKRLSDKEYALRSLDENYKNALETDNETDISMDGELSDEEIEKLAAAALEGESSQPMATNTDTEQQSDEPTESAEGNLASAKENSTSSAVAAAIPKADAQEVRIPSSVKDTAPSVGYTIQVAAYPTKKDAQTKAAKLANKGYAAFPMKVNIKGKTWYRVNIGSFKSRSEAKDYRISLNKAGHAKDSIIRKVTN